MSHPTLEILLSEQADLKVSIMLHILHIKTLIMHMFTFCEQMPYRMAFLKQPYTYGVVAYRVHHDLPS